MKQHNQSLNNFLWNYSVTDRTGWQPLELNFLFFLNFNICQPWWNCYVFWCLHIVPTRKKTFRPMPFCVFNFTRFLCGFTTQLCTHSFVLFFNSGFRSWKTHHQMNKYVLNQNTTLMCTHDFCYFLVFILGIWGAKKGVFAHNHNTEIFSPFNIIFILNFHSLKILPLLHDTYMLLESIVFYHIYAGAHYSINL